MASYEGLNYRCQMALFIGVGWQESIKSVSPVLVPENGKFSVERNINIQLHEPCITRIIS